ncbi:MAG: hypothetical protein QM235_08330 [Pseudomonadota bacterium]|nr:hypothetical protein [Pseudomonadota bacterium]
MSITTILTWVMIAIIFWLALYMIGGWVLVGTVAGVSIFGMSYFLWTERPK